MRTSRYSDSQIMAILKQAEAGTPVPDLCREHGMSSASFYKWRAKFGGMDASLMSRLNELEDENRRLKKMYADVQLQADVLKEAITKNSEAVSQTRDGPTCGGDQRLGYPAGLRCLCHQPGLLPLPTAVPTSLNDMWSMDFMHDQLSDKRTARHEWLGQYMLTDLAEMQDHATR